MMRFFCTLCYRPWPPMMLTKDKGLCPPCRIMYDIGGWGHRETILHT